MILHPVKSQHPWKPDGKIAILNGYKCIKFHFSQRISPHPLPARRQGVRGNTEGREEIRMNSSFALLEGIGRGRVNRIVMGKLKMDIDLLEGVQELAKKEGIQTGVILSGIGALRKATFRNLKVLPSDLKVEKHHRLYLELEQPMEIVSLTGWMATKEDGDLEVHAHFSASTVVEDKVVTLGGHLIPGVITSVKVVVVIGVIEETNIRAGLDSRINQIDVKFSD
jgi:predicted DNA-binding protein with PD1-like motif